MKYVRAGVVPFKIDNNEIKMLFMKPSDHQYGGDCYQIAKGKVEDGEEVEVAAFREAFEELGLIDENIITKLFFGVVLGKTNIFVAEVKSLHYFTETTFETESTNWMTLKDFEEFGRPLHKQVVRDIYNFIESKFVEA